MEHEGYVKVGKLSKAHGLKGEIRGVIDQDMLIRIKKLNVIFLIVKSKPLPYFLEELDLADSGGFLVKLEEVDSRTEAEKLTGKEFYVEEKNLKKTVKETGFNFLVGYKLLDTEGKELGTVENIYEMPAHALAQVFIDKKEVLIPLTNESIVKTDKRKKEITVSISEGLLDIYLK